MAMTSAPAASASAGGAATVANGTGAPSATGTSSPTDAPSPSTTTPNSGGAGMSAQPALPFPRPTVPGFTAKIIHGIAYAPANAPLAVQEAIWSGDRIRLKPYRVGGGHGKWNDTAYDCSGSVSYVLHAAGLLKISEDSGQMMSWDVSGIGQWMTVYTNPGHAFIEIAGIRLDTSA